ncbi:MAG: choice-of-anchor B family protein [Gemmatimonadetes bacterium]|nr:choice-of-anchor B family protein [Gemmatimonadota bacterium]
MFKVTSCRPGRAGVRCQVDFATRGELSARNPERRGHRAARGAGVLCIAVAAATGVVSVTPAFAAVQDDFGSMVAVAGETVIVGKPGAARGPAALYRFERSGTGAWVLAGTLSPPGTAASGSRLSPSMEWRNGRLVVGSGDAEVETGAHLFRDTGNGGWVHEAGLALAGAPGEERAEAGPGTGPGGAAVDFAGIMRILQPPLRVAAVSGNRVAVSVARNGMSPPAVHIFEQGRDGAWAVAATVPRPSEDTDEGFGSALILHESGLFVASPALDRTGAVHAFTETNGSWSLSVTLRPDSTELGARFGSSMAIADGRLVVGAPGARLGSGLVFPYVQGDDGVWEPSEVLGPPSDPERQGFGGAVAVLGDEMWVGAPGTGRVALFGYRDGSWVALTVHDGVQAFGAGGGFGTAIALGPAVAAVGAPGADGGAGAAMVFTRGPDGSWSPASEPLRPGGGPEAVTSGEVRCDGGDAAGFSCDGVDLLAFLPASALGGAPGERVSDVWGWTDPETGREYALVGRTGGAAIIDVTDAAAPRYIGAVQANPSGARDLKVYADHLFFTGDGAGDHGLVVFDLTRVRGAGPDPAEFQPDAVYDGIASAHNLVLDPESGFAFPVGASGGGETCGGGLHMVDVRDPKSPVFAGCFTDTEGLIYPGRTHDAQCVVYRGPDDRFQGRQLCFASNETALRIIDVTDKSAPAPVGTATYPGLAYVHQGWLTDDQRYYYLDDELDELVGTAPTTRTFIFDVAELDDPILVGSVDGTSGATDHNLYVKGDRMYQANYQAGFRLFDISDPEAPREIAWFDTTPYEGDPPGFVGAWTAYPFFESGTVVVTSMYEGVFLLRPRPRRLIP